MTHVPRFEDVLAQVRQLSALDKVRLIERVTPEIEAALRRPAATANSRSLLGVLRDFGPAPSEEDIAEMRREAWVGLPREL